MNFIFYANPTLTLGCLPPEGTTLYSLAATAQLTGGRKEVLRYHCRLGLIAAQHVPTVLNVLRAAFPPKVIHDL